MICALMIGRLGSTGFPKKNIQEVLGRLLCEYPLIAAKKSKNIDKLFVSTDCPVIKETGQKYGVINIERPKKLCTNAALGEDVFQHGYFEIKKILEAENKKIELMVLLMANAPTITTDLIDEGIKILRENPSLRLSAAAFCPTPLPLSEGEHQ